MSGSHHAIIGDQLLLKHGMSTSHAAPERAHLEGAVSMHGCHMRNRCGSSSSCPSGRATTGGCATARRSVTCGLRRRGACLTAPACCPSSTPSAARTYRSRSSVRLCIGSKKTNTVSALMDTFGALPLCCSSCLISRGSQPPYSMLISPLLPLSIGVSAAPVRHSQSRKAPIQPPCLCPIHPVRLAPPQRLTFGELIVTRLPSE